MVSLRWSAQQGTSQATQARWGPKEAGSNPVLPEHVWVKQGVERCGGLQALTPVCRNPPGLPSGATVGSGVHRQRTGTEVARLPGMGTLLLSSGGLACLEPEASEDPSSRFWEHMPNALASLSLGVALTTSPVSPHSHRQPQTAQRDTQELQLRLLLLVTHLGELGGVQGRWAAVAWVLAFTWSFDLSEVQAPLNGVMTAQLPCRAVVRAWGGGQV